MGGDIPEEGELEQGSRFRLARRFAQAADPTAVSAALPAPERNTGPLNILVAEDSEANRLLIVTFLEAAGHAVEIAVNGTDACEQASKRQFDVILMDVQMPQCDGLTATRVIRAGDSPCRDVPIIAVTAHAMAEDRIRCLEAGMDDYLTKPLGAETLLAMLSKVSSGPGGQRKV